MLQLAAILASAPGPEKRAALHQLRGRLGLRQEVARGDLLGRLTYALQDADPNTTLLLRLAAARWVGMTNIAIVHYFGWNLGRRLDTRLANIPLPPPGVYDRRAVLLPWLALRLNEMFREFPPNPLKDHRYGWRVDKPGPYSMSRAWRSILPPRQVGHMAANDYPYHEFWRWFAQEIWNTCSWDPVAILSNMWFGGQLDQLMDWIEGGEAGDWQRLTYGDALAACIRWHRQFELSMADRAALARTKKRPVVRAWADGWTLRELATPQDMRDEGQLLGHCIGGSGYVGRLSSGRWRYLSLHDPKGVPRVSMETELDKAGSVHQIAQLYGRSNARPSGDRAVAALRAVLSLNFYLASVWPFVSKEDLSLGQALACLLDQYRILGSVERLAYGVSDLFRVMGPDLSPLVKDDLPTIQEILVIADKDLEAGGLYDAQRKTMYEWLTGAIEDLE